MVKNSTVLEVSFKLVTFFHMENCQQIELNFEWLQQKLLGGTYQT
jgi:hypothetical protein